MQEVEESGRCPCEICAAFRQRLRECEIRREAGDKRRRQEQHESERGGSEEQSEAVGTVRATRLISSCQRYGALTDSMRRVIKCCDWRDTTSFISLLFGMLTLL
jgi:hypothetical protein